MKPFDEALMSFIDGELGGGEESETQITDIEPLAPIIFEQMPSVLDDNPEEPKISEDLKNDFKFARSNLYALIGRSNAAIELVLKLANMTDGSSKSLETLTQLLGVSSNLTKELLNLHKSLAEKAPAKPKGVVKGDTHIQQNNFFAKEKEEIESAARILDGLDFEKE